MYINYNGSRSQLMAFGEPCEQSVGGSQLLSDPSDDEWGWAMMTPPTTNKGYATTHHKQLLSFQL